MTGHTTQATTTPSVSALNTYQLPTHAIQTPSPIPSYTSTTTHVFPFAHSLLAPRACFTTAWTSDGHKFAIAAQEGALAVWDVQSSVPVWVFWTGMRNLSPRCAGAAENTGDRDGSWDWTHSEVAGQGGGWTADATPLNEDTGAITGAAVEAGAVTPSLTNFIALIPFTSPITTAANTNAISTEGSTVLDPAGTQADPSHAILGVVRTRVDPRLPVQTILEAAPDMGYSSEGPPKNGIRNVRFSAGEGGRELCVFVEVCGPCV